MRRILVLGIAGLLVLVPQINDATARGGFGGGGFHGGGFHGGGFGGFHGGGFGGFHGGFARAGFAPGFAGVRPGWNGGGVRWAGGVRPGWGGRPGWGMRPAWGVGPGWRRTAWGWNRGWGRHRPVWPWVAAGAVGFAAANAFAYDCPLVRQTFWDGFSWRVVWTRSCDSYW